MTYKWQAKFWCEKCNQDIRKPVHFFDRIDEPSEEEKSGPRDYARRLHDVHFHTNCFKCGRNIPLSEQDKVTVVEEDAVICEKCS